MYIDDVVASAQLQCELHDAFEALTDNVRTMDEVCEIVHDTHTALEMISSYGKESVPLLNLNGALEALVGIPEKLITVEKAQEGLGEAAKAAWNKTVEILKKIWNWIKSVVEKLVNMLFSQEAKNQEFLSKIAAISPEVFVKAMHDAKVAKATESMNSFYAEAFATRRIVGYGVAMDLLQTLTHDLDFDNRAIETLQDKVGNLLSNMSSMSIDDAEKAMRNMRLEIEQEMGRIRQLTTQLSNEYKSKLEHGSGEDGDFAKLGWDKSTATKFVKEDYRKCKQVADVTLSNLKRYEKNSDDEVKQLEQKKVDAGNDRELSIRNERIYLLQLVAKFSASDARYRALIISGANMILVKCRNALIDALEDKQLW